ncbi:hypothetical protein JKF63_04471 [Porcisia hertigi]|uniref:Uncharacterized protein n=1 Tax=Porcisia hertigi TaxID=2761500 RepID=A0A836LAT5_9TRYP|nr:hypothetical protein JKF63_04471 [Porcisia hertigi]
MLCVRTLTFVDRAESESVWNYELKKQWSFDSPVAVRVHDSNENVLGSTIPVPFIPVSRSGKSILCASWISEDPVEEPVSLENGHGKILEELPASKGGDSSEATKTPVSPANRRDDCEKLPPPPDDVAEGVQGSESSPASIPPQSESSARGASEGDQAVTLVPSLVTAAAAAAAAAPAETTMEAAEDSSVGVIFSSANSAGSPCRKASAGEDSDAVVSRAPVARRPTFNDCMPINIAKAPKGVLRFQVITLLGTTVAVGEANVQSILKADTSKSPQVQHYAVLITPANRKAESPSTIHAVLEFSVVVETTDVATVVSLAASASWDPMPTPLLAGSTCGFSTHTFYFPSQFLSASGVYIVTNVLCVESFSDDPVQLEIALPEDLQQMRVLPRKKALLKKRGERAYFTCTWDVFSPYLDTTNGPSSDGERISVGFHVLIRDGADSRTPVLIELVGGPPQADARGLGPYMFFVNHAKITNSSCNVDDESILMDILPISLITRAGA